MASDFQLKHNKYQKHVSYRKIIYQRFFVGLLLFIVISLVLIIVYNVFCGSAPRLEVRQPVSLSLDSVPVVKLKRESLEAVPRVANCTFWDCFNVYRCGRSGHDKITIYIYPLIDYQLEDGSSISKISREFYDMLEVIRGSKYYTTNPDDACILVPSIDTLNQYSFDSKHVSRALHSLEFWNNGENHLIFNMLAGSAPSYNTVVDLSTGKSMIAGSGFDTWTFRYGFDISLPLYSEISTHINNTQPLRKQFLIISSQTNMPYNFLSELKKIASSSNDLLLLEKCASSLCQYKTRVRYEYPKVLKSGLFCLVVRSARLAQTVLLEAIASQCIPIIVADNAIMPFNSHIDWNRIAIFIPENNINNLLKVVQSISKERRGELYWQLRWIYERYFSSIEKITLTTLEIINEKVFPLSTRMYEEWNMPEHIYGPVNPLFLPTTASKAIGFTAVILTYDRVDSLFTLIRKLAKTPSLVKIIVVWNNQKKAPPLNAEWPVINKPLKLIRTKENKLSNRFYPYDDIETECQLTIDDDIVMLTPDELEFGFDVWREFPDRIVGFPSRLHVFDNATGNWRYHSEWTNQISMVLTGAAFHHKVWSYYYTYKMPQEIRHYVDEIFNCEDIAMNFLVANITRRAPIKVAPRKKFKCPECINTEMLSADARHMTIRSQCIDKFSKIYGHMALKTVEFRADPLQYKENNAVPLQYPEIGAL